MSDATTHTWVVSFDISDDHRRTRLSRFLESQGLRVQWSVFEVLATEAGIEDLIAEATRPERFLEAEDNLRCYRLCASCRQETRVRGLGRPPIATGAPMVL